MSSGNRFLKDNDSVFSKGNFLTNWNRGAILADVKWVFSADKDLSVAADLSTKAEKTSCDLPYPLPFSFKDCKCPRVSIVHISRRSLSWTPQSPRARCVRGDWRRRRMVHTFSLMKLPVRSSFFSFVRCPQMFAICWRAVTVFWSDDPSTCKPQWERSRSVIFVRVKITGVLSLIPCTPSTFFLMWRPVTISGWIKWKSI